MAMLTVYAVGLGQLVCLVTEKMSVLFAAAVLFSMVYCAVAACAAAGGLTTWNGKTPSSSHRALPHWRMKRQFRNLFQGARPVCDAHGQISVDLWFCCLIPSQSISRCRASTTSERFVSTRFIFCLLPLRIKSKKQHQEWLNSSPAQMKQLLGPQQCGNSAQHRLTTRGNKSSFMGVQRVPIASRAPSSRRQNALTCKAVASPELAEAEARGKGSITTVCIQIVQLNPGQVLMQHCVCLQLKQPWRPCSLLSRLASMCSAAAVWLVLSL
jgi:hypothetical protein